MSVALRLWSTLPMVSTSRHLLMTSTLDEKHTCGHRPQSSCEAGASCPRLSGCPCMLPSGWMNLRCPLGSRGKRHVGCGQSSFHHVSKDIPTSPWLWVDIFKLSVLSRQSHHRSMRKHCMLRGSLWQVLLICHFASDIIHNN